MKIREGMKGVVLAVPAADILSRLCKSQYTSPYRLNPSSVFAHNRAGTFRIVYSGRYDPRILRGEANPVTVRSK